MHGSDEEINFPSDALGLGQQFSRAKRCARSLKTSDESAGHVKSTLGANSEEAREEEEEMI